MEKEKSEELAEVFRQLIPANQRQLMTMVQVAEHAENNMKDKMSGMEFLCSSDENGGMPI